MKETFEVSYACSPLLKKVIDSAMYLEVIHNYTVLGLLNTAMLPAIIVGAYCIRHRFAKVLVPLI